MKFIVDDPNFSIIMPGGCNAHCDFCFYKHNPKEEMHHDEWTAKLHTVISFLPKKFKQVSVTGGEPTLNPEFLFSTIGMLKNRFDKVVLTTNGFDMDSIINIAKSGLIDFLNISRHHHTWDGNSWTFGSSKGVRTTEQVKCIIENCHKYGIPVTINCVVTKILDVEKMIDHCRYVGAYAVRFRTQSNKKPLYDLPINDSLNDYIPIYKENSGDI